MQANPDNSVAELDAAEFVALLTSAQPSIWACIFALMPERSRAQDVLQETNVTLWQKRTDFQRGTNFLAWARRVARNHVLNQRRKLGREPVVFSDDLLQELLRRQAARDERHTAHGGRLDALRHCLEKLDEAPRSILARRYGPGGSVQRLAQDEGRSVGAISQLLYRLREALLSCIEARTEVDGNA